MSPLFSPQLDSQAEHVPRRRLPWPVRLAIVLLTLVALTVAAAAIYAGTLSQSVSKHLERQHLLPSPGVEPAPDGAKTGPAVGPSPRPARGTTDAVNYVLMGSDSRQAAGAGTGRSDTLMVLHLTADRRHAYLISFPRDMWVNVPGHGKNKINAAFAFGGPQLTVRTLEELLDTRMDHAVVVDFDGFVGLTEKLGGITVVNKHESSSRGHHFPAGQITLEGDQALAYVRERYGLPNGDLDRAERQRDVVKAILAKGLSGDTIANPVKFNGFVAGIAQHLVVDSELSDSEIRKTALSLRMTGRDVRHLQAPISGFATMRGQSIDVVNHSQLKELSRALREDRVSDYLADHPDN